MYFLCKRQSNMYDNQTLYQNQNVYSLQLINYVNGGNCISSTAFVTFWQKNCENEHSVYNTIDFGFYMNKFSNSLMKKPTFLPKNRIIVHFVTSSFADRMLSYFWIILHKHYVLCSWRWQFFLTGIFFLGILGNLVWLLLPFLLDRNSIFRF